jgi:Kef-type K+ transport system membrane component KefB
MLGIAAFDDVAGIIIYTIAIAFSSSMIGDSSLAIPHVLLELTKDIGGSVLVGVVLGLIFKYISKIFKKESDGSLIVIVIGIILLGYGISDSFGFEPLLTSMTLGAVVINTNSFSGKIFNLLERYTDELIFVVFFSLSGLHLQLSSIGGSLIIIAIYVFARMAGKFTGIYTGASILKTDLKVKKYTAWGLFPQGGIVIGLALLLRDNPAFNEYASTIIGIVIGAALIHEILGPLVSKIALKKSGDIKMGL